MIKFKSFEESVQSVKGQYFDYLVDDYIYNSDTKSLSLTLNKKDIFEFINSFASSSLDAILDKYSSIGQVDRNAPIVSQEDIDLSLIGSAFDKAEDYRERNNLSSELSYREIYDIMLKESQDLANKLKEGGEKDET